jgi:putative hydrolase of the HAD superfamily
MATSSSNPRPTILFDWGDTLMRVDPRCTGPMVAWPEVIAVPHSAEALSLLRPRWGIALATSADESTEAEIRAALARVGLDTLIEQVYSYKTIGFMKPSLEFYTSILGDLGLPPSQVVMVGDSFKADVLGANAAGIYAIWFNEHSQETLCGPQYQTIHSLLELPAVIEGLNIQTSQ